MGSLWPVEEGMVRKVIQTFRNNKIVIFPQTLYFTDDEEGRKQKDVSKKIYGMHKNLTLFLRENKSYELAKIDMKLKNVYLAPDMVLALNILSRKSEVRKNVLFCLRNDKERVLTEEHKQMLTDVIKSVYPEEKIIDTDTVSTKNVWKNQREKAVYDKIEEFSKAKLIVTDRLHGMVFAALACTPCIVMGSCNYKVKGIYQWIENNQYISFIDDINRIRDDIEKVINAGNAEKMDKKLIDGLFETLRECVL